MATRQSTVKWFDAKKGYGFINHPDGGNDVFVHYTQIDSDKEFKTLRTGQTVEFEMNDGPKGLHALNVSAQDEPSEEPEATASESEPEAGPNASDSVQPAEPSSSRVSVRSSNL